MSQSVLIIIHQNHSFPPCLPTCSSSRVDSSSVPSPAVKHPLIILGSSGYHITSIHSIINSDDDNKENKQRNPGPPITSFPTSICNDFPSGVLLPILLHENTFLTSIIFCRWQLDDVQCLLATCHHHRDEIQNPQLHSQGLMRLCAHFSL